MWYLIGGLAYVLSVRVDTTLVWLLCAVPFVVGAWVITLVMLAARKGGEMSQSNQMVFTLVVLLVWGLIMTEGSAKLTGTLIVIVCGLTLLSMLDPHAKRILLTGWDHFLQVFGPIGKFLQQIPNP